MTPACIDDYRLVARERLPFFLFEYVDGGSYSEATMRSNTEDFQRFKLRQQVMRDVATIDLSTTMFGTKTSLPVALGPVGLAGLYARRGEVQAVKAAHAQDIPFFLSASACCAMEEVAAATSRPICLQLYMIRDREFMKDFLARAERLGIETLMLTVDLAVHSARHRDVRSGLTGPQGLGVRINRLLQVMAHPGWAWDVGLWGRPHILGNFAPAMAKGAGLDQFTAWVAANFDPSLTWKDVDWIRQHWKRRLVVKGVLEPNDALEACNVGAEAVIVSNHGGRQLDGAPSTITALPAVVDAIGDKADVMIDGGIRSGVDVLRAMALGAKGVLLGRAWAWALAAEGGAGVSRMLDLLRHEIKVAMALTGQTDVKKLTTDMLLPLPK